MVDCKRTNQIKMVLAKKNLSGKWLVEQLGKSICTVSKWCSNKVQPDLPSLDQIAKILGVDVKDLLVSTKEENIIIYRK